MATDQTAMFDHLGAGKLKGSVVSYNVNTELSLLLLLRPHLDASSCYEIFSKNIDNLHS